MVSDAVHFGGWPTIALVAAESKGEMLFKEVVVQKHPDPDPRLVEIENAIDVHGRVRENSVDPNALRKASKALENALLKAAEDDPETPDRP